MTIFQSRHKDMIVKRTQGIQVETDSNVYLDAISGMFNMLWGYSCDAITSRICRQIQQLPFHPKEHFYSKDIITTSDLLLKKTGLLDGGVLFLSSGSEAVEAAIFMAIEHHIKQGNEHKKKIIARTHSYHGATLGARSVTGRNYFSGKYVEGYNTVKIAPPFAVTTTHGYEPAATVADIEQTIHTVGAENIAAFIFEPVNHLKGMHQASLAYLKGVRALCDQYDIVMITDEIVSGLYRTGAFLNTHLADVLPDITLLGKGLSGGYAPVAALIANKNIASSFDRNGLWRSFSYSHTYAANPIAIAAVTATLHHLEGIEKNSRFHALIEDFHGRVRHLLTIPSVVRAESSGLLAGVTFSPECGNHSGKLIEEACFASGVIIRGEDDWITLAPSFSTSHDEINTIFHILEDAVRQL